MMPTPLRRLLIYSLLTQMLLLASFTVLLWQAEQAMDKTGIGNVEQWEHLNQLAGISLYGLALFWLTTFVCTAWRGDLRTRQAQLTLGLPPLALIISWCALFFI